MDLPASTALSINHRIINSYIHTGKGGEGGESTREKVRGARGNKAGSKIPT
jgi:hypothetical protein